MHIFSLFDSLLNEIDPRSTKPVQAADQSNSVTHEQLVQELHNRCGQAQRVIEKRKNDQSAAGSLQASSIPHCTLTQSAIDKDIYEASSSFTKLCYLRLSKMGSFCAAAKNKSTSLAGAKSVQQRAHRNYRRRATNATSGHSTELSLQESDY